MPGRVDIAVWLLSYSAELEMGIDAVSGWHTCPCDCLFGCNGANTSLSTIQMSGATERLPPEYAQIATKAIAALPIDPDLTLSISEPRTVVGTTPLSPRRWYVCASGIASPGLSQKR